MSAALYIVLEREGVGSDASVNGKALSKAETALDQIARQLSVTPLMEFFSLDPEEAAEVVEEHGGDPDTMEFEEEQWHEASSGLASVRALRDYVAKQPSSGPNAGGVIADLADFERVLQSAQEQGLRWHLSVDY